MKRQVVVGGAIAVISVASAAALEIGTERVAAADAASRCGQ